MIKGLIVERAQTWEQAKEMLDRESAESRSLDATEREQYERMNGRLGELDARIEELHQLNETAKRNDEYRAQYETVVPQDTRQAVESTEEVALRELITGKRSHVDLSFGGLGVRHDSKNFGYEVRALGTYTAGAGGNTIPTSFVSQLYEHMVENSAIRQTNARVVATQSGEALEFPKVVSFGTAAIVGEGTALAGSDPSFGKVTLNAWKYGQLLQYPSELAQDTGVDLLGMLARDFGRALGNASGAHYITGTGTNQPNGVVTAVRALGTAVAAGTAGVTGDSLIDLYYAVIDSYARDGYWLMRRATEARVRKLKDSNGQYLWQPSLQVGSPNLVLGRPVVTDPNVAVQAAASGTAVPVLFGDFSAYVIRDVAGVRIERSDDYAFNTDTVSWRAIIRTDGDLLDATGAIKAMSTIGDA